MGKPIDEVIGQYIKFESGTITLWISKAIKTDEIPEIKIGVKKLFFVFRELTLSGIPGKLIVE